MSDLTPAEYQRARGELEEQAKAVGADAIVTHHHKCHREWSKFGSPRLPVIQYHSLVAEALGIIIPDRFQELWQLDNTEQILEQTRTQWDSWGLTEDQARGLVTRFFVPAYAASVQDCPCEGDCSEDLIPRPDVQPMSCSAGSGPYASPEA